MTWNRPVARGGAYGAWAPSFGHPLAYIQSSVLVQLPFIAIVCMRGSMEQKRLSALAMLTVHYGCQCRPHSELIRSETLKMNAVD